MTKSTSEVPGKLFYKIGEVCEITDTQPYVLRFWESEFPQLAPKKNRSGQRVYKKKDIDTVLRIKQLLYEEEYTIAGARKKLEEDARSPKGRVAKSDGEADLPESVHEHPVDALSARSTRGGRSRRKSGAPAPDGAHGEKGVREEALAGALGELKASLQTVLEILRKD